VHIFLHQVSPDEPHTTVDVKTHTTWIRKNNTFIIDGHGTIEGLKINEFLTPTV